MVQSPMVNAFTIGMDRPFIVLTTGMLDIMTYEEQRFVVGHELARTVRHAVYRTVLMHLMRLAAPSAGFRWAVGRYVRSSRLMEWQRKSELSGDRAGLLCGQDVHTAIRVQLKLAGGARISEIDVDAFLAQAASTRPVGICATACSSCSTRTPLAPFSVLRAAELKKWVDNGEYAAVLRGDYPRRSTDHEAKVSEEFRNAARTYKNNFDTSEDPLIKTVRDIGSGFTGAVDAVGNGIGDVASDIKGRFDHWRKS
ncbi:M48 family peptidase [Rhodococcus sp. SBT000017]|nr:M48 family peptidase [Rhodococcus sp. SBT000017]